MEHSLCMYLKDRWDFFIIYKIILTYSSPNLTCWWQQPSAYFCQIILCSSGYQWHCDNSRISCWVASEHSSGVDLHWFLFSLFLQLVVSLLTYYVFFPVLFHLGCTHLNYFLCYFAVSFCMLLKCSNKHAMEVSIFVGYRIGWMYTCSQASLRLTCRFSGQVFQGTKTTIKLPGCLLLFF